MSLISIGCSHWRLSGSLASLLVLFLFLGCTANPRFTGNAGRSVPSRKIESRKPAQATGYKAGQILKGKASWYGPGFHGKKTASGEIFDMNKATAAHKELPLGTWLQVKNLANGKKVEVLVNDRGPYKSGRILDLSKEAARKLNFLDAGTADVEARILTLP